jgi:uncharacterized protein (TIGR00297 family)
MTKADLSRRSGTAAKADHSETTRKIVHMSMVGFALLLRWLTWWQAIAMAGAALAFNLFLLPRIAPSLYRPRDRERKAHGIVFYPLAVLMLIVLFPSRTDIVGAAWGILAIGDGVATLAGRAIGGPRWPWNADKTIAGSIAFAIGGALAGCALAWWCRPAAAALVPMEFAWLVPPVAAIVAALVETLPVKLDDNLSVAASAGTALWLGSLVCARYQGPFGMVQVDGFQSFSEISFPAAVLEAAIGANLAVAAAGYAARTVSISGAICGALIGIVIFVSLGWQGWTLLLVTFLAASIATRTGRARKQQLGIAEDRGGRRGAGNAIANTGVAAIAAMLAGLDVHPGAARLAFVAALVAGGSDTIASEIGKAYGRRTWSVTSLGRVPPGTSGAMSVEGTVAGVLGALGLGAVAVVLSLLAPGMLVLVVVSATIGSLVESWLGATLEKPGILNNDLLNFINTAISAGVAVLMARI